MTVLIDDGEGNERAATVFAVTVIRDKDTGDVTETTLTFNGTGRVKNHITYGPHEVVILPEPRQNPHTRLSLYATSIGEPMAEQQHSIRTSRQPHRSNRAWRSPRPHRCPSPVVDRTTD